MAVRKTAGYSGTPLAQKLGIKAASHVYIAGEPLEYQSWLEPLPEGVRFTRRAGPAADLAHIFVTRREELTQILGVLRQQLKADAAIWISWPKQASKVPTTVSEHTIRELALPLGLVDIKVCAVSEIWSGLKLMVRKELR